MDEKGVQNIPIKGYRSRFGLPVTLQFKENNRQIIYKRVQLHDQSKIQAPPPCDARVISPSCAPYPRGCLRASSPRKSVTVVVVEQGTKEPVIGAVVRAEGATTPRVTGIDGECTLTFTTAVSRAKFKVSFMGYKTFEEVVPFHSETITIVLTPDNEVLDDVIVTGQKRYTLRATAGRRH